MNAKWMATILCLALTGCQALANMCVGVGAAIAEGMEQESDARNSDRTEGAEGPPIDSAPPSGPIAVAPVRPPRSVAPGPNLGATITRRLQSGTLICGRRYELRVSVRNHGDRTARPTFVALTMQEDGRRPHTLDQRQIPSLRPGQDVELVLGFVPSNTGDLCVAVEVDPRGAVKEPDHARSDNRIELRRTVAAARPRPTGRSVP